jgi:hypothetical protein
MIDYKNKYFKYKNKYLNLLHTFKNLKKELLDLETDIQITHCTNNTQPLDLEKEYCQVKFNKHFDLEKEINKYLY